MKYGPKTEQEEMVVEGQPSTAAVVNEQSIAASQQDQEMEVQPAAEAESAQQPQSAGWWGWLTGKGATETSMQVEPTAEQPAQQEDKQPEAEKTAGSPGVEPLTWGEALTGWTQEQKEYKAQVEHASKEWDSGAEARKQQQEEAAKGIHKLADSGLAPSAKLKQFIGGENLIRRTQQTNNDAAQSTLSLKQKLDRRNADLAKAPLLFRSSLTEAEKGTEGTLEALARMEQAQKEGVNLHELEAEASTDFKRSNKM